MAALKSITSPSRNNTTVGGSVLGGNAEDTILVDDASVGVYVEGGPGQRHDHGSEYRHRCLAAFLAVRILTGF